MMGSQADREALARDLRLDAQRQLQRMEALSAAQRMPATAEQRALMDQLALQVKRHASGQL